ncbi:hypothetical protein LJR230_002362 [Trinickia sp. LjRoot230]|uniref:hypothetical protein n=1 Tax=Trinickia sp. LjRoot230 TaxID=3342288 RepID=UPI003ECCA4FE
MRASDRPYDPPYANPSPGHYTIIDSARGVNIQLAVGNPDPAATEQDSITVTEIFRDEGMEKGSGVALVLSLLDRFGVQLRPGGVLVLENIQTTHTLEVFASDVAAGNISGITDATRALETLHGKVGAAIVRGQHLEVERFEWHMPANTGRVSMHVVTRAAEPPASYEQQS